MKRNRINGKSVIVVDDGTSTLWADGVYSKVRMDKEKSCLLVVICADNVGRMESLTTNKVEKKLAGGVILSCYWFNPVTTSSADQ